MRYARLLSAWNEHRWIHVNITCCFFIFVSHQLSPPELCVFDILWRIPTPVYLERFHGGQRDVGEELSRGGGGQVEGGAPQVGLLLAQHVGVDVLEQLVEAELAQALHRVADEGGRPAAAQTANSLLLERHLARHE